MAKPDDRSDNAAKLQEMISNTQENIRETESYLQVHGDEISNEERTNLEQKNERREESVEGYRAEIADESSQAR